MIELYRFAYFKRGVLGRMVLPNGAELFTVERPWLNNKPFVSCIPEGDYELEWDTTGRIKNVPRLRDVPNRTQINIHPANYPHELHGCIAPGLDWNVVDGVPLVSSSRDASALLMEVFNVYKGMPDRESLGMSIHIARVRNETTN